MGFLDRFRKNDEEDMKEENNLVFTSSMENEILFGKATECLQKQENEDAVRLFDELIAREPDNVHAINGKGSGLMQLSNLDEAESCFNKSLGIRENEMALLNMVIIYKNKKDYDNALICCDKIMESYPGFKDIAYGFRNDIIDEMGKDNDECGEFSVEARELINKANELREKDEMWEGSKLHQGLMNDSRKFRKITVWDSWELYEEAIEKDPKCESTVLACINDLKASLLQEFLFFDISQNNDFNPEEERDKLKLMIMKDIIVDNNITDATILTNQLLSLYRDDLDAVNFKGAISFYNDELDEAIECFEKVAGEGNEIYRLFGDYNKAFVLRRKTMVTNNYNYMTESMDIYDEMLKNPELFDKVKPYQREILDKIEALMNVPLF